MDTPRTQHLSESDVYAEIGNNYRYFLTWRHAIVAAYLGTIAAVAYSMPSLGERGTKILVIPSLGIAGLSLLFWALEVRNRTLFRACCLAGAEMDKTGGGSFERIWTAEGSLSHGLILDVLFIAGTVTGLAGAVYFADDHQGTVSEVVKVATFTTATVPNAAPDPALIEKHCPFGAPTKLPSLEHGPTQIVARNAYALEHDAETKIALWVCGSLDKALVFGDAERANQWKPDPNLDGKPRAIDADYRNSGYQRGHMVASEDRVATQALNDATFFLSNAVPQDGPLNAGQWAQLEATIRRWVETGVVKNAKMITGGFFYDPQEDDPSTADGLITFKQIGRNVAVPTHVFKIVVGEGPAGTMKAIAFVAQNGRPKTGWTFADGIVAIDWLEERAGLNFMPDLDPADEATLEKTAPAMWQ